MKKSKQIIVLGMLINGTAALMFIIALLTQQYILTPFGFVLLIGYWVIRLIAGSDKKKGSKKNNRPEFKIFGIWDKFIAWLNK